MASLSSHSNVYNTCLHILRQRGYRLWVEGEQDESGCYPTELAWMAEKNGATFHADNPIELMGLAAIYEHVNPVGEVQPGWWTVQGPDIKNELLEAAFPDDE